MPSFISIHWFKFNFKVERIKSFKNSVNLQARGKPFLLLTTNQLKLTFVHLLKQYEIRIAVKINLYFFHGY